MNSHLKLGLVILLALVIPSGGHAVMGKSVRGLMLLFWMLALGFITYKLSGPEASFVGRFAGGFAVWALSVVDAAYLARRRFLPGVS